MHTKSVHFLKKRKRLEKIKQSHFTHMFTHTSLSESNTYNSNQHLFAMSGIGLISVQSIQSNMSRDICPKIETSYDKI